MGEYETQGRGALPAEKTLWKPSMTEGDVCSAPKPQNAAITTPWRSEEWRKVVKQPEEAKHDLLTLLPQTEQRRRPATAGGRSTADKVESAKLAQATAITAPWRTEAWRKTVRDPKTALVAPLQIDPAMEAEIERERLRISTPWRDAENWSKARKSKPARRQRKPAASVRDAPQRRAGSARFGRQVSAPSQHAARRQESGDKELSAMRSWLVGDEETGGDEKREQAAALAEIEALEQEVAALKASAADSVADPDPEAGAGAEAEAAAAAAATSESGDYELELRRLYAEHNPAKLAEVADLLCTYKGKEQMLLQAVRLKYTADSHTTPLHAVTLRKVDPHVVYVDFNGGAPLPKSLSLGASCWRRRLTGAGGRFAGWACDVCTARDEPVCYHADDKMFDMCRSCVQKERELM
jgi:hypothetical protein